MAVIVTFDPLSKVPPPDTLPPSPAEGVIVYCFIICDGGLLGDCESSLAQVRSNRRAR
jgi:hypothetical protein